MGSGVAPCPLRLHLVDEIVLERAGTSITLTSSHGEVHVSNLGTGTAEALARLASDDCDRAELERTVLDLDGLGGLSRFSHLLEQWMRRCFVEFTVWWDERRLVGLHPTVPMRALVFRAVEADARY
jgi:hypothetical protein